MNNTVRIIRCYGITKDPETNNFMIVMHYANGGSLRQRLNKNSMNWDTKLHILYTVLFQRISIAIIYILLRDFYSCITVTVVNT